MAKAVSRSVCVDDEHAITQVILRYGKGIDTRDWSLFRSCFSEDCEADYGSFGQWRGPSEITEYMRQAHAQVGTTLHRLTNICIEACEEGACVRTYVDALLMPLKPDGHVHRGIGVYDDRFVRTAQGWKISRRTFTSVKLD